MNTNPVRFNPVTLQTYATAFPSYSQEEFPLQPFNFPKKYRENFGYKPPNSELFRRSLAPFPALMVPSISSQPSFTQVDSQRTNVDAKRKFPLIKMTSFKSTAQKFNFYQKPRDVSSKKQQESESNVKDDFFRISTFDFKSEKSHFSRFKYHFSESFSTNKMLSELKKFLGIIFSYQPILRQDLMLLRRNERSILIHILESKKYNDSARLVQNLKQNSFTHEIWNRFFKVRRKEENLKYSFKLIIKYLQNQFLLSNEELLNNFSPENAKLIFYLYYFYELQTGESLASLLNAIYSQKQNIWNRKLARNWKTIDKYILPEMGTQSSFSKVRSISKEFMISFVRSKQISEIFTDMLVKITLFLCYAISKDWKDPKEFKFETKMNKLGREILKIINKTNSIEINKLFSEWDNKINLEEGVSKKNTRKGFYVDVIKRGIKRKNFKFPWTFKEVQNSFIETLFSYLEILQFHYLVGHDIGREKITNII